MMNMLMAKKYVQAAAILYGEGYNDLADFIVSHLMSPHEPQLPLVSKVFNTLGATPADNKLLWIREWRQHTGLGIMESKTAVEYLINHWHKFKALV